MKLCLVTFSSFDPPKSGTDVFAFQVFRGLRSLGYDVYNVSYLRTEPNEDDASNQSRQPLLKAVKKAAGTVPIVGTSIWLIASCFSPRFVSKLIRLILRECIDVVIVEGIRPVMASWLAYLITGRPVIVNMYEVNSAARMPYTILVKAFFRFCELLSGSFAKAIVVSNKLEKRILIDIGVTEKKVYDVPPGVDYWRYEGLESAHVRQNLGLTSDKRYIAYVGDFHWKPNRDAAIRLTRQIMKLVNSRKPSATLLLIGRNPPNVCKERNVICLGWVSEIAPYIVASDVAVAPIEEGGGIFTKVLEYLSAGKPTVVSPLVARNLGLKDGVHVLVASSDEEFAEKISAIINDAHQAEELSRSGKMFVKKLNWGESIRKLSQICETCVSESTRHLTVR